MIHYGEGSISKLEQERRALAGQMGYWKNTGLRLALPLLILSIMLLLGNWGVDKRLAAAGIALIVLSGLGVIIWIMIRVSVFKSKVKKVVLPLVLARIWPDSRYDAKAHLGIAEFLEADLSDSTPDDIYGHSLMTGEWAGVQVRMSHISATENQARPTKDGLKITNESIFSGLLLVAEIGGYLRVTRLQRRSQGPSFSFPNWMGGQSPEPSIATEKKRPDQLETFFVQVPDSAELDTDLLQPELENALIQLTKHFKGAIHYQLNQQRLLVAVANEAIDIQVDTTQPLHQQPSVKKEAQQLEALLKVVEATQQTLND